MNPKKDLHTRGAGVSHGSGMGRACYSGRGRGLGPMVPQPSPAPHRGRGRAPLLGADQALVLPSAGRPPLLSSSPDSAFRLAGGVNEAEGSLPVTSGGAKGGPLLGGNTGEGSDKEPDSVLQPTGEEEGDWSGFDSDCLVVRDEELDEDVETPLVLTRSSPARVSSGKPSSGAETSAPSQSNSRTAPNPRPGSLRQLPEESADELWERVKKEQNRVAKQQLQAFYDNFQQSQQLGQQKQAQREEEKRAHARRMERWDREQLARLEEEKALREKKRVLEARLKEMEKEETKRNQRLALLVGNSATRPAVTPPSAEAVPEDPGTRQEATGDVPTSSDAQAEDDALEYRSQCSDSTVARRSVLLRLEGMEEGAWGPGFWDETRTLSSGYALSEEKTLGPESTIYADSEATLDHIDLAWDSCFVSHQPPPPLDHPLSSEHPVAGLSGEFLGEPRKLGNINMGDPAQYCLRWLNCRHEMEDWFRYARVKLIEPGHPLHPCSVGERFFLHLDERCFSIIQAVVMDFARYIGYPGWREVLKDRLPTCAVRVLKEAQDWVTRSNSKEDGLAALDWAASGRALEVTRQVIKGRWDTDGRMIGAMKETMHEYLVFNMPEISGCALLQLWDNGAQTQAAAEDRVFLGHGWFAMVAMRFREETFHEWDFYQFGGGLAKLKKARALKGERTPLDPLPPFTRPAFGTFSRSAEGENIKERPPPHPLERVHQEFQYRRRQPARRAGVGGTPPKMARY